jgi:peptidoglycan/xylan/chitin deacetylase (PgdA/CDA1 family)
VRIPGIKTAGLVQRWLRSRFTSHALILGYHRVANSRRDPFNLCVSPENFIDHLDRIRRLASPTRLSCLVQGLESQRIPERSIVVTFDDGYADLLENAKPLLERYEIPASIFIVTSAFGNQFWWDKLEAILLDSETLPEHLSLALGDDSFSWQLQNTESKKKVKDKLLVRKDLLHKIFTQLIKIHPEKRNQAMAALETWAGYSPTHANQTQRALSEPEVALFSGNDLIEIGCHSATHPWLSDLPLTMQRNEIYDSKAHLEHIIGRPVTSFSYPHGSMTKETMSLVKQAGYRCSCTSEKDVVNSGTNPFRLPRLWVKNWDGPSFERWLRYWL